MSSAFGDVPGSRQLTKAEVDLNYHYYAIQKNNKNILRGLVMYIFTA